MTEEICDLCGNAAVEPACDMVAGARGRRMFLCTHCGMVRAAPIANAEERQARLTLWSDLDLEVSAAQSHLVLARRHLDFDAALEILDLGAKRGHFLTRVLAGAPHAHVTAIEPNPRLTCAYRRDPRVSFIPERLEDVTLPREHFDLVYAARTLAHLQSPRAALTKLWQALKPGGRLLVQVPNLRVIANADAEETYFGEEPRFHFATETLHRLLSCVGFKLLEDATPKVARSLTMIATKVDRALAPVAAMPREVENAEALLAAYAALPVRRAPEFSQAATA
ncbi:MAG: methyltransferase domain-containing protein [Alphaproteobacteria bacterium]|nr:methyltransferase domain-containing protein [Alphaproteobacteria bacterium]